MSPALDALLGFPILLLHPQRATQSLKYAFYRGCRIAPSARRAPWGPLRCHGLGAEGEIPFGCRHWERAALPLPNWWCQERRDSGAAATAQTYAGTSHQEHTSQHVLRMGRGEDRSLYIEICVYIYIVFQDKNLKKKNGERAKETEILQYPEWIKETKLETICVSKRGQQNASPWQSLLEATREASWHCWRSALSVVENHQNAIYSTKKKKKKSVLAFCWLLFLKCENWRSITSRWILWKSWS